MLVVEVIKLNRILDLLMTVSWHLMLHIAMSNWFMDWQKYPKSKMSIRIWQHETLDSIKCHTFPGLGSRTLDILLHNFRIFFVPKVLIEIPAHTNNFIVIPARFVCARASQSDHVLPSQLDAWLKAVSGQHCWGGLAGFWPVYPVRMRAQQDTLSNGLCQLHSNQPPFKLRALPLGPSRWRTAATSAPPRLPRPASPLISALKRSMLSLGPATSCGWGGGGCWSRARRQYNSRHILWLWHW